MGCFNVIVNPQVIDVIVNPFDISRAVTENEAIQIADNAVGTATITGQFNIIGSGLNLSVSGNNIIISPSGVSANINYIKTSGTSGVLNFNNGLLISYI